MVFWMLLGGASPALAADLRIELAQEGWGDATQADVHAVLVSAAEPLWKAAGSPSLPRIRVEPTGGPIVLHRRAADGSIRVRLAVQGRRWAQMAYQFGHEMAHILCGFDEDPDSHHWLEEAACEAASIYTLRKMAKNCTMSVASIVTIMMTNGPNFSEPSRRKRWGSGGAGERRMPTLRLWAAAPHDARRIRSAAGKGKRES